MAKCPAASSTLLHAIPNVIEARIIRLPALVAAPGLVAK